MAGSEMRTVYAMSEKQMPEWKDICKAFANQQKAELKFVNETSCGLEYPDGTFAHVSIEDMIEYLGSLKK